MRIKHRLLRNKLLSSRAYSIIAKIKNYFFNKNFESEIYVLTLDKLYKSSHLIFIPFLSYQWGVLQKDREPNIGLVSVIFLFFISPTAHKKQKNARHQAISVVHNLKNKII